MAPGVLVPIPNSVARNIKVGMLMALSFSDDAAFVVTGSAKCCVM